jgi:hypothetical protein
MTKLDIVTGYKAYADYYFEISGRHSRLTIREWIEACE